MDDFKVLRLSARIPFCGVSAGSIPAKRPQNGAGVPQEGHRPSMRVSQG